MKLSAGEGEAVIGVEDTNGKNWPMYSIITEM